MPSLLSSLIAHHGSLAKAGIAALLFASEDYCAATGIERTRGRMELLYPRAQLVTVAKAFGVGAIVSPVAAAALLLLRPLACVRPSTDAPLSACGLRLAGRTCV